MAALKDKYNQWTKDPHNGELLFYMGFTLSAFLNIMRTTLFPDLGIILKICLMVSALLLATKIILFDSYTFKMFAAVAAMLACCIMVTLSSGYVGIFLWVLDIVAAKDIPFRKILQVYLLMNITIMGLAFFASLLGVIENLAYTSIETERLRYSFGCVYTTDFAAHVFYMVLAAFYLYHEQFRWYHYVGTCIIDGLVFYFCHAKLDTTCIILVVIFFGGYRIVQSSGRREQTAVTDITTGRRIDKTVFFKKTKAYLKYRKIWAGTAVASLPVLGALMYYLSASYRADSEIMAAINEFITGRLSLAYTGLKKYGITLFGKNIPMEGFGGSTKHTKPYFFIDSSYLFILLRYGLVFLGMVFIIYGVICYKNRQDTALMLVIVLLAISSSIDHHLMEEAYNPFAYALFASGMVWKKMEVKYERIFTS
ncbi:MAG TPA: hypothetical protein DCZ23_07815 [Lachnospiraceae bacterium]|nr:hypothetical protein [Lachnospiraceae bacterium]